MTLSFISFGVGEEELLASDLILRDRLLSLGRNDPVYEVWPISFLTCGCLAEIDEDHAVLVEQALIASTEITRSARFLNDSQVPRSVSA